MHWRFRYRALFFFCLVLLAIAGRFFSGVAVWPVVFSPQVYSIPRMFQALSVSDLSYLVAGIVVLILLCLCIMKRRPICHTICPAGFCFDVIGRLQRRLLGRAGTTRWINKIPSFGLVLFLLSLAASLWGGIGFLWLDPFVLFGSCFRESSFMPGAIPLIFLGILVLAWAAPTFWCRRICPLGGLQDGINPSYLQKRITGPTDGLTPEGKKNGNRRLFLFGGLIFGAGLVFGGLRRFSQVFRRPGTIRPPGAVEESYFTAHCTRCGNCIQACPTRLLKSVDRHWDFSTPYADFTPQDPTWCETNCNACSQVCPSAAIRPFRVADKKNLPFARAVFIFEYCRLYDDIECSICARECPYEAISYQWNEEEYRQVVEIDERKCTGCGWCVAVCPVVRQFGSEPSPPPLIIEPLPEGVA